MRVLHSVSSVRPETGGPARSVPAPVSHLKKQEIDARLNVCEMEAAGGAWASAWKPAGFATALQDWRPQIVHDHGVWLPSNHQAAAFARTQGIPLVVSPRGMLEPWSMNHRRLKKKAAWLLYQRRDLKTAHCLHATSFQEADHFRELGLSQPVIVVPNGVSVPAAGIPRSAAEGRERVILFVSRIHPKKGLPLLLEAWRRIRPQGWKIRIVGPDEGGHADEIRSLAKEWGIDRDVSIEPPVDDQGKWDVYASADVFVLPTYSENFGIVVAEALAAGLPVITTTGTPWTELEEWRAGWCVAPTADAIESALLAAVTMSDEQRIEMGRRGREAVVERFSWSSIAGRMREAYLWMLGGGVPPECVRVD